VNLIDGISDKDAFLRELHHRVKNNFQMIASLINLQKRMLPAERRSEVRFVEEHVQSMAVAYRTVIATDGIVQVVLGDLVSEVVDGLRQIAGANRNAVVLDLPVGECIVRIEQAIAVGLYLAVLLPPYLDVVNERGGSLRVALNCSDPERSVLTVTTGGGGIAPDALRQRLGTAYLRQLRAELDATAPPGTIRVRFRLQPPGSNATA
jgi:hypothetical protein